MPVADEELVLLTTKLHAPVRRVLIPRPRLVELLRPCDQRLTLLEAPAGWGKTSLLAQWSTTADGSRAAWLGLDHADNDPVQFWTYVVAALRTRLPTIGERTLAILRTGGRALREAAIPALLNELAAVPEQVTLVFDDYHVLTDTTVNDTMTLLLERLPPRVHIVIATRSTPALPTARLRAAGELREVHAVDLAFTAAEAATLLAAVPGTTLSPSEVSRLSDRAEGWPTGLALAAASLAGRRDRAAAFVDEFTGSDRYVLEYLVSEVLTQLPEDLQRFLLQTSILPRLSAASCDAVTGEANAAAALSKIEKAGVFLVPLDGARRWFRHHRLFGELLRHELALTDPTRMPELHRRAAAWSAANGAVGDAVGHLIAAGDVERAGDLVATRWNDWFNRGRLTTVAGWLDQLPPNLVRADARLCAARAWLLLDLGRLEEVDGWLAAGDAAATELPTLRDMAVLRTVHRFKIGNVGAARSAALRVLELTERGPSFTSTVAHLLLGVTAFWADEPEQARRKLGEAVRLARATENVLAETYALGYLALTAAENGALDDAARLVPVALERAAGPDATEHFVAGFAHLAQAVLLAASGHPEPASTAALRALELARRGSGRLELALALTVAAQTATAAGADGGQLMEQARTLARRCPDPGRLRPRLARVTAAAPVPHPRPRPAHAGVALSEREQELLPLLAGVLSQREIGGVLHLSLNTVKTHSRVLFRKLGVSSRAAAVDRARELGLL